MAAHNGHDEQHQRLSVHTKQHGCREQRWRHHNQRGHNSACVRDTRNSTRSRGEEGLRRREPDAMRVPPHARTEDVEKSEAMAPSMLLSRRKKAVRQGARQRK